MDARTDEGSLRRRSALLAAAAAGLAVPLAHTGPARAEASPSTSQPGADLSTEPVIAHVRNARTGEIDIFRGTAQVRVHDVTLAALLARAAR